MLSFRDIKSYNVVEISNSLLFLFYFDFTGVGQDHALGLEGTVAQGLDPEAALDHVIVIDQGVEGKLSLYGLAVQMPMTTTDLFGYMILTNQNSYNFQTSVIFGVVWCY